ncbi:MAG: stage II sporulation protein M, partial [Firmicutes bacterium]|nr:stage II sporulation protein M [Bacillota bacterium]
CMRKDPGAILPQNLIYVPTTIVAGVFAVTSSLAIFRSRFQSKSLPAGGPFFMQYVILILLLGVCLAVGSLVESMITPVFMRVIISIL